MSESPALSLLSLPSTGDMASPSTWRTDLLSDKTTLGYNFSKFIPWILTKAHCGKKEEMQIFKKWLHSWFLGSDGKSQIEYTPNFHPSCPLLFGINVLEIVSWDFHIVQVCVCVWWMMNYWNEGNTLVQKISFDIFMTKTLMKIEFLFIQLFYKTRLK